MLAKNNKNLDFLPHWLRTIHILFVREREFVLITHLDLNLLMELLVNQQQNPVSTDHHQIQLKFGQSMLLLFSL